MDNNILVKYKLSKIDSLISNLEFYGKYKKDNITLSTIKNYNLISRQDLGSLNKYVSYERKFGINDYLSHSIIGVGCMYGIFRLMSSNNKKDKIVGRFTSLISITYCASLYFIESVENKILPKIILVK